MSVTTWQNMLHVMNLILYINGVDYKMSSNDWVWGFPTLGKKILNVM